METKTGVVSEWVLEERTKLAKAISTVPCAALCCITAAVVLFASYLIWVALVGEPPPPVLPPAGEVIEGSAPFRFAVVGDSRGNQEVFEEILARIRGDDVSFILHTGDIVDHCNHRNFEWVLHELAEEDFTVPFCAVPGNHDIEPEAPNLRARCRLYARAFGPRRYWFAYANALFVAFDDSTERCSEEDLRWLDRTLSRFRKRYDACFVYMHVPPRDPRPWGNHSLNAGADELIKILQRHEVGAVFASHIHSYAQDEVAGVPVFISGGAGADLERPDDRYHYLLCTVGSTGSLGVQKREVNHQLDTDYAEYVFYVKFPSGAVLLLAAGLTAVGVAFVIAVRTR